MKNASNHRLEERQSLRSGHKTCHFGTSAFHPFYAPQGQWHQSEAISFCVDLSSCRKTAEKHEGMNRWNGCTLCQDKLKHPWKIKGSHEHCRLPTTLPKLSCRRPSSRMVHLGEPSCADEINNGTELAQNPLHVYKSTKYSIHNHLISLYTSNHTPKMPYSCSNPQILRIVSDLSWSADAPNASAWEWSKSSALKDCISELFLYSQELCTKYCYILHLVVSRHTETYRDILRIIRQCDITCRYMSQYVTMTQLQQVLGQDLHRVRAMRPMRTWLLSDFPGGFHKSHMPCSCLPCSICS